jgi:hypothetical protein
LSPSKQQPFQRPSSPRIILQPIAAERGPGAAGGGADRIYLSGLKHDIHSVCKAADALQRDLDMQRRPTSNLAAKNALARRPLTPSAAAEPNAAFRSDAIESGLSKILSAADVADGATRPSSCCSSCSPPLTSLSGVKPALKIQALELLLQACDDAARVAIALTDKHVGADGRSDSGISASSASKISSHCSMLARLQDLHVLLEGGGGGGGASVPKPKPAELDGRPPLHPADAGRATPSAAAAAVPALRLIAASLNQPLQGGRLTFSDFVRSSTQILKDVGAPVPPVTSAPSVSALRSEVRSSVGLERVMAGDAGAEVDSAVRESADSIAAAVTAIGDAAAAFPWCAPTPPPSQPQPPRPAAAKPSILTKYFCVSAGAYPSLSCWWRNSRPPLHPPAQTKAPRAKNWSSARKKLRRLRVKFRG